MPIKPTFYRNCLIAFISASTAISTMAQESGTEPAAAPSAEVAPAPSLEKVVQSASAIDCVEVDLFKVSEEKVEGQTDRAEKIPERNLEIIRDALVKRLPKNAKQITSVASGQESCPNPATSAVLGGDILDFRKGNMALRYFVGFGAGSQKVRVRLTLRSKTDDTLIAQEEIADTKWSGAFGGTNTKGLNDFAEKAAEAAGRALKKK